MLPESQSLFSYIIHILWVKWGMIELELVHAY